MTEAIIGLIGVLLGLFISEYFRRRSRIEDYAKEIFLKRLKVYEELYSKMNQARKIASEVIESDSFSNDERSEVWSSVVMGIADFNDKNELYINEEISLHCFLTLMGVEDIYSIDNEKEKEAEKENFWKNSAKTISMIRDETGLEKIDKYFGSLTKAKHTSEYLDLYKESKRKYNNRAKQK